MCPPGPQMFDRYVAPALVVFCRFFCRRQVDVHVEVMKLVFLQTGIFADAVVMSALPSRVIMHMPRHLPTSRSQTNLNKTGPVSGERLVS